MVLVEEVPEEQILRDGEHESDFETDSNVSDDMVDIDDDDFIADETLYDRVVALKDMVPPQTRSKLASNFAVAKTWAAWGAQKTGSLAWIFSTSALLVGLPLALAIEDETRIVHQEREMQMQSQGQQQVSLQAPCSFSHKMEQKKGD